MGLGPHAPCHPRRRFRRPVRAAVTVSLAVHVGLGLFLVTRRPAAPAPSTDTIQVDFTVAAPAEGTAAATTGSGAETSALPPSRALPSKTGQGASPSSPVASRSGRSQSRPATPGEGEGQGAIVESAPGQAPAGPAGPGAGDRFASFASKRPDLGRVPGFLVPEAKRDPLAAPRTPERPVRELPGLIHGPGGVTARIDEDGAIHFQDPKAIALDGVTPAPRIGGSFDLNDQIARLAGQDPYAATKRKMAEETHEQRLCMARRAQHARESQALLELSDRVRAIAGRPDWTPEKRRRTLFEIWDECEEGDSDYAAMARATIAAIIRQLFPEGSAKAYQPQELLALNRLRTSRHEFAPYLIPDRHKRGPEDRPPPDAACPVE